MALGVESPWNVMKINFEERKGSQELHVDIDFTRGTKFADESEALCDIYDTKKKTWRHLNFFHSIIKFFNHPRYFSLFLFRDCKNSCRPLSYAKTR